MKDHIFTRGISHGDGFCNRVQELKILRGDIESGVHSILVSPRRYGKTSLAFKVIEKSGLPYAYIDLFMKYSRDDILDEFHEGLSDLLGRLINPGAQLIKKLESFIQSLNMEITIGAAGVKVGFSKDGSENLKPLLQQVEQLLEKLGKKAIIFIDEVQTIAESDMSNEFEASLRFIAQKTKHLVFMFSGSNRRLLAHLFEDKSRPFYKLCHKLTIHKISAKHYHTHIDNQAIKRWNTTLDEDILATITDLTLCHSYYINVLSERLFRFDNPPTLNEVHEVWNEVCLEEQGSVARDLEFLTAKQKQLLSEIAKIKVLKEPTSSKFLKRVNLTGKGVLDAIKVLLKYEFIEKDERGLIIAVDPVLCYWA